MKENIKINSNLPKNHPSYQSKPKQYKPSIKVNYKIIYDSKKAQKKLEITRNGKKIISNKNLSNIGLNIDKTSSHINDISQSKSRVKSITSSRNQNISGRFHGSQYYPHDQSLLNESRNNMSQKAKVTDARAKYQHSNSVDEMIKGQYVKKNGPSSFVSLSSRHKNLKTQSSHHISTSRISSSKYFSNKPSNKSNYLSQISSSNLSYNSNDYRKLPSYSNEGIKDIIEYEHAGEYRQDKVTGKCLNFVDYTYSVNKDLRNDIKEKFKSFNQMHEFDFRKRVNTLINQANLKGLRC